MRHCVSRKPSRQRRLETSRHIALQTPGYVRNVWARSLSLLSCVGSECGSHPYRIASDTFLLWLGACRPACYLSSAHQSAVPAPALAHTAARAMRALTSSVILWVKPA